jgi:hypothetical protein
LFSCAWAQPTRRSSVLFPRASVEKQDVDRAIEFEAQLRARYDTAPPEGAAWFEVLSGTAPVVISAPHATTPTRRGAARSFADGGTGSLAVALHRLTDATVIYTTYESPSDPNFYDENDYKRELGVLIASIEPKLVLDLHASHWNRPYDVDFGTLGGSSLLGNDALLRLLADHLRSAGLVNFSQDYFAASRNATVTKWVAARGVPCIQLEISSTWMVPPSTSGAHHLEAHRFAQLLEALTRFVRAVAEPSGPS